jgi:hypothetical protein
MLRRHHFPSACHLEWQGTAKRFTLAVFGKFARSKLPTGYSWMVRSLAKVSFCGVFQSEWETTTPRQQLMRGTGTWPVSSNISPPTELSLQGRKSGCNKGHTHLYKHVKLAPFPYRILVVINRVTESPSSIINSHVSALILGMSERLLSSQAHPKSPLGSKKRKRATNACLRCRLKKQRCDGISQP